MKNFDRMLTLTEPRALEIAPDSRVYDFNDPDDIADNLVWEAGYADSYGHAKGRELALDTAQSLIADRNRLLQRRLAELAVRPPVAEPTKTVYVVVRSPVAIAS